MQPRSLSFASPNEPPIIHKVEDLCRVKDANHTGFATYIDYITITASEKRKKEDYYTEINFLYLTEININLKVIFMSNNLHCKP